MNFRDKDIELERDTPVAFGSQPELDFRGHASHLQFECFSQTLVQKFTDVLYQVLRVTHHIQ